MGRTKQMDISPEQFLKMTETLARVDERTAEMKIQMEKYQASFDTRMTDIEKRVGVLEGWKGYVFGVAAACTLIMGVAWNLGGDYVKSHLYDTSPKTELSIKGHSQSVSTR